MLFEIGVILVLVLANGLFAGTEAAMIAARRGRLQQSAEQGNKSARVAVQLQEDPNRFLSTVQVGITLIGTLAGAFGGVSIATRLTEILAQIPAIEPFAGSIAFVTVVVAITYLSLVVGELVPKRLALQSAEAIATMMAQPMLLLSNLSRPIVVLLGWSTEVLLALLGRRNVIPELVTEEDIRQLVREGTEEGVVEPQEQILIESVFKFGDRSVRHILTPRRDVYALDADAQLGTVLDDLLESGFSRFPVYEHNLDHVVGIVHVRDLLRLYRAQGGEALVRDAMYSPLFVPESIRASMLLATFRKDQRHMAVVVNEHGGVEGIVTLEDVLEEIVGEIADEYDESEEQAIIRRDDGSLLIDGMLPIDELKQCLGVEELPDEEYYRFDTLAGFVLSLFGHIPNTGDAVNWGAWRFEVIDMDGLRIDKILVTHEAASTAP